jgi:hypothetical protein
MLLLLKVVYDYARRSQQYANYAAKVVYDYARRSQQYANYAAKVADADADELSKLINNYSAYKLTNEFLVFSAGIRFDF